MHNRVARWRVDLSGDSDVGSVLAAYLFVVFIYFVVLNMTVIIDVLFFLVSDQRLKRERERERG